MGDHEAGLNLECLDQSSTTLAVRMVEVLLGVDLGTSSSKGVLCTPTGQVVASAVREHTMSLPRPGWAEVDAVDVWWRESTELMRELVAARPEDRIAGVCVSGVGPCLVLCDEDLRPVRPAILYGIDTRAGAEIEELTARYGAERIIEHGGNALSSQAVGPKLAWVRAHEPEVWDRARGVYASSSFITARLTGEYVLDHHTASQYDPLYDLREGRWNAGWVIDVCGDLELPRLAWPGEVVGSVTREAATETGLPPGTPVTAGTVDAWAEAFSAGVRAPGDTMLMYGSTMFLIQQLAAIRTHPGLWTTTGVLPGTFTLAAGMATSGSLLRWLGGLTGGVPFRQMVAEAEEVRPGSEGLVVLPFFAGERAPIFDPEARGLVAGLTLRHTRGHLFRAAYEGIACGVRQILELLEEDVGQPDRLVAVGGGTQGGLWPQIVSNVTGHEQLMPQQTIGASYGDALLAAIGTGMLEPGTDWTVHSHVVGPDPQLRPLYDELYATYRELYPATRDSMHRLAAVQRDSVPTKPGPLPAC